MFQKIAVFCNSPFFSFGSTNAQCLVTITIGQAYLDSLSEPTYKQTTKH